MSFGSNDLTQSTFGLCRDDVYKYLNKNVLKKDSFQVIDQDGVGGLIRTVVEKARSVRDQAKIGICGEQGGDPESVSFCNDIGLS